ncbi:hypothetical protein SGLAM104S_00627 [Streptomyces glaucescens]
MRFMTSSDNPAHDAETPEAAARTGVAAQDWATASADEGAEAGAGDPVDSTRGRAGRRCGSRCAYAHARTRPRIAELKVRGRCQGSSHLAVLP